ncbi:excisionase family DNA-binding protein [Virgibacillus sp. DJP39]|uniref:excisionase family DNA-binding protein n=1 Tax=Virgibacillus sp. DJP39 TaxID=3409790 RepID=UPI003BB55453
MYLTIEETAEHLSMPESQIRFLIQQKRIRTIHDGENYLINKDQFSSHFEQVEKYKKMIQDYLNEPIPEDIDVKDED